MLFNSLIFPVFVSIVFFLYWFLFGKNLKAQNLLIVISSYIFYGWWDWRFAILMLCSTIIGFFTGNKIQQLQTSKSNKNNFLSNPLFYLKISLFSNLGILLVFKYFGFFSREFTELIHQFGITASWITADIILPVGISFYTFQVLGYSVDVYRKKVNATNDLITFTAFISFFPQLVAGPIERASELLPQFLRNRTFSYQEGTKAFSLILFGFFKKLVVADNCAQYVNYVFSNFKEVSSPELIIGTILFAFQIYCDFSGYSDIARGTAKLFGFELMENFKTPYFSQSITEFWRRWHISLSTWFRDYVYFSIGGSKKGKAKTIRNILIVFILSGLWHGANWTFIIWGLFHAFAYTIEYLIKPFAINHNYRNQIITTTSTKIIELIKIIKTFSIVSFGWIFFRSDNISSAFGYIGNIFSNSSNWNSPLSFKIPIAAILLLLIFEFFNKNSDYPLSFENKLLRRLAHSIIILIILFYGAFINPFTFIYFQF